MTRALLVLALVLAGVAGAAAPRATPRPESTERPGADSGRVARLLNALARTDPVVCDLIGDQLGNFWMGNDASVGRFEDAPDAQGAKDSLAGTVSDPKALSLLQANLGAENACVRRGAAKLLGNSTVSDAVLGRLLADAAARVRESAAYAVGVGAHRPTRAGVERLF